MNFNGEIYNKRPYRISHAQKEKEIMLIVTKMLYLSGKADPFITSFVEEYAAQDFNKIDEDDDIDIEMLVLNSCNII